MGLFRLIFRLLGGNNKHPTAAKRRSVAYPVTQPPKPQTSICSPAAPHLYPKVPRLQVPNPSLVAPFATPALLPIRKISGPCYVVDGDTIIIEKIRIRLSGIDAPELDQPYGNKAKWVLINLCKGQVVTAVFNGSSTYDRPVATCYLPDGGDLSEAMVRCGMALDWRKFSDGKYRHLEPPDSRKRLWRVDAKHRGLMPPPTTD